MSENLWAVIHIPEDLNGPGLVCIGEALRLYAPGALIIDSRIQHGVMNPMMIPWIYIKSLHTDKEDAEIQAGLLELELMNKAEHKQRIDDDETTKAFERLKKIRIQEKFETDFG